MPLIPPWTLQTGLWRRVSVPFFTLRRLAEVIFLARSQRLEPKRIRLVQAREGEESNLFLMECIKEGGSNVKVEKPLIIYEGDNYSEEVKGYYA